MRWRDLFRRPRSAAPPAAAPTCRVLAPTPHGAPSEAWNIGDLAELREPGKWISMLSFGISEGPQAGDIYRVRKVLPGDHLHTAYLAFTAHPGNVCWGADAFRKITPHADTSGEADAIFCAQMKTARVVSVTPREPQP